MTSISRPSLMISLVLAFSVDPLFCESGLKAMKSASRRDSTAIAVDLTSPEPRDRGQAAQALSRLGGSANGAVPSLLEVLTDFATYREENDVRAVSLEAARALRQVDPKAVVPA